MFSTLSLLDTMPLFLLVSVTYKLNFISSYQPDNKVHARMFKGKIINPADYPYFVTVMHGLPAWMTSCGGSLIDDRWVITAARCTTIPPVKVAFGLRNLTNVDLKNEGFVVQTVIRYLPHYLALIELPSHLKHDLVPISLPDPGDDQAYLDSGKASTIVAMGFNIPPTSNGRQLQELKAIDTSMTQSNCTLDDAPQFTEYTMCSVSHDPHEFLVCPGDFGSPSIIRPYRRPVISGVVSWTSVNCKKTISDPLYLKKHFGILIRVEPHMAFILHSIDMTSASHHLRIIMDLWMAHPLIKFPLYFQSG